MDRPYINTPTNFDELSIEEIAKISNVNGLESGFIASDNLESDTFLSQDYIESIGNFRTGTLFKVRFTMMLFCISGEMEIQFDLMSHTLHAGEVLVVREGTVTMGLRMNPAVRLFFIGFSRKFFNLLPPSSLAAINLNGRIDTPVIKLTALDMADILAVYKLVNSRISAPDFRLKNEVIVAALQIIGCILSQRLVDTSAADSALSRKQIVTKEFIRLVGKFASSHRNISFYARKLCISSKYLGQVVSEISGETPHSWICRQVILEAKALLGDPNLTIQQISETLNFNNQSFFGTFFRKHTGISPKAYRLHN